MAEITLGDILGAALAEVRPLSSVEQVVASAIGEDMVREQEALANR